MNGTILKEATYVMGDLEGKVTTYYPTGTKKAEIFYKHGLKTGYSFSYDGNGKLISKKYYVNGYELTGKQLERHIELKKQKAKNSGTKN